MNGFAVDPRDLHAGSVGAIPNTGVHGPGHDDGLKRLYACIAPLLGQCGTPISGCQADARRPERGGGFCVPLRMGAPESGEEAGAIPSFLFPRCALKKPHRIKSGMGLVMEESCKNWTFGS